MDKRRAHRLSVKLPASFQLSRDEKFINIGTTFDISATGLCLLTREELIIGQKFPIKIMLPTEEVIKLNVEVVWIKDADYFKGKDYLIGVKILEGTNSTDDTAKFIKFYAQKLREFK